jgi:hypothetical protein
MDIIRNIFQDQNLIKDMVDAGYTITVIGPRTGWIRSGSRMPTEYLTTLYFVIDDPKHVSAVKLMPYLNDAVGELTCEVRNRPTMEMLRMDKSRDPWLEAAVKVRGGLRCLIFNGWLASYVTMNDVDFNHLVDARPGSRSADFISFDSKSEISGEVKVRPLAPDNGVDDPDKINIYTESGGAHLDVPTITPVRW